MNTYTDLMRFLDLAKKNRIPVHRIERWSGRSAHIIYNIQGLKTNPPQDVIDDIIGAIKEIAIHEQIPLLKRNEKDENLDNIINVN
jgi:hypothetical protein